MPKGGSGRTHKGIKGKRRRREKLKRQYKRNHKGYKPRPPKLEVSKIQPATAAKKICGLAEEMKEKEQSFDSRRALKESMGHFLGAAVWIDYINWCRGGRKKKGKDPAKTKNIQPFLKFLKQKHKK